MAIDPASAAPSTIDDVTERARNEVAQLDRELGEIEMLVNQARAEAARHEQKRSQAADKAATVRSDPREAAEQSAALVTLTRRAAVMEAQVDVLEGKRKALSRFRDAVAGYADDLASASPGASSDGSGSTAELTPAMSRVVLRAQEDLRREIARSMHDGPAQSLTNIVLQAQIVERLVMRDQHSASIELRQLIAMVQQTLEATKTFIFDVRPMVLDDLGLVPTMRRAARDRGQRARVAVEFDSLGTDRRLPMDIESTVFRILDEALAAYLAAAPERLTVRLDWGESLEAYVAAERDVVLPVEPDLATPAAKGRDKDKGKNELPPALVEMVAQRKADHEAAITAAHAAAIVALPANVRREILARAASIDAEVEIADDGSSVRLVVALPPGDAPEPPAG